MTTRIRYSTLAITVLMLVPLRAGPAKGGPYLTPTARQVGAPAAQLRDVRGVWIQREPGRPLLTPPPPMTAWAKERFRANLATVGSGASLDANDPTLACMPPGVPYILDIPVPFEIIPLEGRILQLFEYNHNVRQLFTDGRPHPTDLQDSERAQWMGHSIASWEGNTLVVDTVGFNDRTWLDRAGHPHSSDLHLVERIRRLDEATLEYGITIDDPKAYTQPWQGRALYAHRPQWQILEHHCMPEGDEYGRYHSRAWQH